MLDACFDQLFDELFCQLRVCSCQQFTRFGINDVLGQTLPEEVFARNDQLVDRRFLHVPHVLGSNALAVFDDQLATKLHVKRGSLTTPAIGDEAHLDVFI